MDLGNIGNKLLDGADKNATLIGAGVGFAKSYYGLRDSLGGLLFGSVHGPNVTHIKYQLINDPSYRDSIIAIIGGYLMQESGISMVDRAGKIIIKAATGFLLVRLAENVLWSMTHSPAGSDGSSGNSSPNGNRGYS